MRGGGVPSQSKKDGSRSGRRKEWEGFVAREGYTRRAAVPGIIFVCLYMKKGFRDCWWQLVFALIFLSLQTTINASTIMVNIPVGVLSRPS